MRKGSRLANWETFREQVLAAAHQDLVDGRQFPSRRRMATLGHQNLVSAAYHHHGGWTAIRQRLCWPFRPTPRKVKPPSGYGKYAWSRFNRVEVFRRQYPEWWEWHVLPPINLVVKRFPGIVSYYQHGGRHWADAGLDAQLLHGIEFRHARRYGHAVLEALEFRRQHGRWPKNYECSSWLRGWRYSRQWSWPDCLISVRMTPIIMDVLVAKWHIHLRQLRAEYSMFESEHRGMLNAVIIARPLNHQTAIR